MSERRHKERKRPAPSGEQSPDPRPPAEAWFGELARALGWNPLVAADLRPVLESYARTADSWAAANRVALGAALAVAECQFRIVREALEEGLSANADLLCGADPVRAVPEQAWRAVRGFERLIENLRELTATVARSQAELAEALERRLAELSEEVERHALRLKQ